jgi:diguanylate cyclase (GGDEF)-like protein
VRTVDTVGRVGGEEFMIVAPETTVEGAQVLGERIRQAVEQYVFVYKSSHIHVTVSVGLAVVGPGISADYDQLKHVSASALGEAKAGGRNRSVVRTLELPAGPVEPVAPPL